MDPLSILSLTASTASAAYTVSIRIYNFINAAKDVNENVTALASELSGLRRSLDAIEVAFKNPLVRSEKATASENAPIWAAAAGALDDCRRTLISFENLIGPSRQYRTFLRKSVATWKLNLKEDEIKTVRTQVQVHTNSLQISLQMMNILIAGVSPANVVEDIGKRIDELARCLENSVVGDVLPSYYSQVQSSARQMLNRAPELVATGLFAPGNEETRTRSTAVLRSVITDYNKSLRSAEAEHGDATDEEEEELADSDDEIETSLTLQHLEKAQQLFQSQKYEQAEASYRDGLRHSYNVGIIKEEMRVAQARLHLAICCLYQENLEEAEIMLLVLGKETNERPTTTVLQSFYYLGIVYLCMFDFDSALEYATLAVKAYKRAGSGDLTMYHTSMRLLALVHEANGDFLTASVYSQRIPPDVKEFALPEMLDKFTGYSPGDHLRMTLGEKKAALMELSQADLLRDGRPPSMLQSTSTTLFKPGADALDVAAALTWAAANDKFLMAKWLLARGTDTRGSMSNSPAIVLASFNGTRAIVKLLLDCGADVDAADGSQRTSLFWSSLWGHESTVHLLIASNCNIDCTDSSGETALIAAASKGHISVMRLLLASGASAKPKTKNGHTALTQAFLASRLNCAKELIESGVIDLSEPYQGGSRAIHLAVESGSEHLVELLLDKGAHVNSTNDSGSTPLIRAASVNSAKIAELLLRRGANPDLMNKSKNTAMHLCCESDRPKVLRCLLESGADPNKYGYERGSLSPYATAKHRLNKECASILREYNAKDCRGWGRACDRCERFDNEN